MRREKAAVRRLPAMLIAGFTVAALPAVGQPVSSSRCLSTWLNGTVTNTGC